MKLFLISNLPAGKAGLLFFFFRIAALCLSMTIPHFISAHPGIGIVKDSHGYIYFTDLEQVWKIDPATGKKIVVVPNVHTHELYMDANNNLYGEHTWYNGEQLNTWGYYVWCLKSDGSLVQEIESKEGFLKDYSFVRDSTGNMYWVERSEISQFKRKNRTGDISTIAEGKFKDIRWIYCNAKGEVYFIDLTDLYKIELTGKIKLLAKDLASQTSKFALTDKRHRLFGIWTDKEDNVYIANYSGQAVKKVDAGGKIKKIAYSRGTWGPTGGLFDEDGNLWLLEASITNSVRVRKVLKETLGKHSAIKYDLSNNILPIAVVITFLIGLFIVLKKIFKRIKSKRNRLVT